MPLYNPPWDTDTEPSETNVKNWMDNLYGKFEPIEQARWNQSNIDTLFYAGEQRFINSYFNFNPTYNSNSYFFNLIQQPINMVTGFQRQHRKSINYTPLQAGRQEYADDLTKVITYANNYRGILEKFSVACEQSAVSGLCLIQPYLDFTDDPVNGTLDLKVWSYNSFMCDPYYREPDMSDCNFVWCQQYLSKAEAINYFPKKADFIKTMSGYGNRYGKFYFLPENYNLSRNDLLVLSHVWYRSKRMKKMLYNRKDGIAYDYVNNEQFLDEIVDRTGLFEIIEVQVPTWKVAVVLNEQLMYLNYNPLHFDECPFIPVYWNRDPHMAQYDLRDRSLTRCMRSAQYLLNRRIILNHDISESSINSGWLRRENTIVNEDELRYAGQGKDIIVKENDQPLSENIQKIVPNAVPPSDMQLAEQLSDFIFKTSGVSMENFGAGESADKLQSGLAIMLKQGAGLMVLQKYFDQWDLSLKLLGKLEQKIIQSNWSAAKIQRILGEEPNVEFQTKTFSQYDVLVSEGLDTTIQQQQQFMQMLQLNEILGGIIPPKLLLKHATIQGKNEIIEAVEQAQAQASQMQQQEALIKQSLLEAQIQNMQAKSAAEVATARERHGRAESNIGLFEERISEISRNHSLALKDKMEALQKLMEIYTVFGKSEANSQFQTLSIENFNQEMEENRDKIDARAMAQSNNFLINNPQKNTMENEQLRSALL